MQRDGPPIGYQSRRFEPADPEEHEASNEGRDYNGTPTYDLQDFCTCGAAFHSHYNGWCPK